MREAFSDDYLITIAAQADMTKATNGFNLTGMSKQIDMWNLMSYDYSVSDISSASVTAPNEPLYAPSQNRNLLQDNVKTTIDGYIKGVAYYGHTWYIPDLGSSQSD